MSKQNVHVSVVGASGFAGMEAIRLLIQHPQVVLQNLYGNQSAGTSFDDLFPSFKGLADRIIKPMDQLWTDQSDVILFALPHGSSAKPIAELIHKGFNGKILDMGSDYRLKNAGDYQTYYNMDHPHPELLDHFVYGLPEFNFSNIKKSNYIAVPGCFATAIQLALLPLVKYGCSNNYHITAMTGSSGSGAKLSTAVHFSHRFGNVKAYKVLAHQHMGEINQSIGNVSNEQPNILFTPVSGPYVRGIWLTVSFVGNDGINIEEIFKEHYGNQSFVRLRKGLPELKNVVGSNFADIGWQQSGNSVVVGSAIDNLIKGAAGQAIQNLNIVCGFDETAGLRQAAFTL